MTLLQGFRNYLHYHIKASKSYMQSRMRTRVGLLLEGNPTERLRESVCVAGVFFSHVLALPILTDPGCFPLSVPFFYYHLCSAQGGKTAGGEVEEEEAYSGRAPFQLKEGCY